MEKYTGICNLCLNEKNLCDAHIIPKSLKKIVMGTQEKTMKALSFTTDKYLKNIKLLQKPYNEQNLIHDHNILCEDCDKKLGIYDKEFVSFYKEYINSDIRKSSYFNKNIFFEYNLYPNRIYLGFAACLFRYSISKNFPQIKLGKYQEYFRKSLFEDNYEEIKKIFRIHPIGMYETSRESSKVIFDFYPSKIKTLHFYYTFSLGMTIIMTVGQQKMEDVIPPEREINFPQILPDQNIRIPLFDPYSCPQLKILQPLVNQVKIFPPSTPAT